MRHYNRYPSDFSFSRGSRELLDGDFSLSTEAWRNSSGLMISFFGRSESVFINVSFIERCKCRETSCSHFVAKQALSKTSVEGGRNYLFITRANIQLIFQIDKRLSLNLGVFTVYYSDYAYLCDEELTTQPTETNTPRSQSNGK